MSETLTAKVVKKSEVAKDIFSFVFKTQSPAPKGQAGSHIDVHLGDMIRQYSLISSTGRPEAEYQIAVLREADGRGGSVKLCDTVCVGDEICISVPRNNFELELDRSYYVLLGAGIGVTPLIYMANVLQTLGKSFEFRISAQKPDRVAMKDVLDQSAFADKIQYHFSKVSSPNCLELEGCLEDVPERSQIYACGPTRYLDEITALTKGWPQWRVRMERFTNEVEALSDEDSGPFTVEFHRSGGNANVPSEKSLLDVMNDAGVSMASSCLEGVCGTCITPVISGDIIHRDACLYDEEKEDNTAMAPCVSRGRPGTTVVLDI